MERFSRCCLLTNSASGSNEAAAVEALRESLSAAGISIAREIGFPDQDIPSAAQLDAAHIPLLVIFTGDGSANAAVSALQGWGGAALVLPGGTMNLLAKRLHRVLETAAIVELVGKGAARRVRPSVAASDYGFALAGLLVGPGTCWSEVREATRDMDLGAIAENTLEAIERTAGGPPVSMVDPKLGREEGYQLIEITPGEHGLQFDGFYADSSADFARQGWAVMRRRFREGPHDRIGMAERAELRSADGSKLNMLLDGEPVEGCSREKISVQQSPVDLLATGHSD